MARWALALVLAVTVNTSAQAQDELPHFRIDSLQDLVTALSDVDIDQPFPRAAIVALEGSEIMPWLKQLVSDTTAPMWIRVAAIETMGFMRSPGAETFLLLVAGGRDAALADAARGALEKFESPNVCGYWRDILRTPRSNIRLIRHAVRGIASCGSDTDREMIRRVAGKHRSRLVRQTAAAADTLFRNRLELNAPPFPFGGPPDPSGRFVPSGEAKQLIIRALCGNRCRLKVFEPDAPVKTLAELRKK